MKKRVYIAGPISSVPIEQAEKAFSDYEQQLIRQGYAAFNPFKEIRYAEMDKEPWEIVMKHCLTHLFHDCDEIHFLPGWEKSRGAALENYLAIVLHIPIVFVPIVPFGMLPPIH